MSNKLTWLEEVKADAAFNYKRRMREQEEKRLYEESKKKPVKVESVKKESK